MTDLIDVAEASSRYKPGRRSTTLDECNRTDGRAIERLIGYPAPDFINSPTRNMASVIHPDDLEPMRRIVDVALKTRNSWELEFRLVDRNGTTVWIHEVGCGVFDNAGSLLYLEGMIVRNLNPSEHFLDATSTSERELLPPPA